MTLRSVDAAMGVHRNPKGSSQEFDRPGPGGHLVDEKVGRDARARRTRGTSAGSAVGTTSSCCASLVNLLYPKSHDMMERQCLGQDKKQGFWEYAVSTTRSPVATCWNWREAVSLVV